MKCENYGKKFYVPPENRELTDEQKEFIKNGLKVLKMTDEIDYRWCWMQLRNKADTEHNAIMDMIEKECKKKHKEQG